MKKLLLGLLILLSLSYANAQVVPAPTGVVAMVCANNTVVPTPTSGQFFYVQCDAHGNLITSAAPSLSNVKSMAFYGDSFAANASTPSLNIACTTFCQNSINGSYFTWAQVFSGYSIFRNANGAGPITNCGWSGQVTAQILGNWSCVLTSGAQVVLYSGGTNDVIISISCATTTDNNRLIYQRAAAAGIFMIKATIIPRPAFTTAQAEIAQCDNEYDRRYAEENPKAFTLVDMDKISVDATQPTAWNIVSGFLAADATHPSEAIGGPLGGELIAAYIRQVVPSWRKPQMSNGDVYDATNNPTGNLLPNGAFCISGGVGCGTAGTITTCTGTSPTGVSIIITGTATGLTCAASTTTLSDSRTAVTIVLGGTCTCTNGIILVRQIVVAPSNINTGDTIEGQIWFKIGTNTAVAGLNLRMQTTESAAQFANDGMIGSNVTNIPTTGITCNASIDPDNMCLQITPRRTITAVPTQVFQDLQIQLTNGAGTSPTGTITIASESIKKVFQ